MTLRTCPSRFRPSGFTLMELLVVIAIIGILLGLVSVGTIKMGKKIKFDGEARKVHDMIVCARNVAIAQNRRVAVRITQSKKLSNRWKLIVVDSKDNVFDDNDEEAYNPIQMKHVNFDGDQEIELSPEGGISYWTSNPLVIRDDTDEREPWMKELTLYPGGGAVEMGELKKLTPAERDAQRSNDTAAASVATKTTNE